MWLFLSLIQGAQCQFLPKKKKDGLYDDPSKMPLCPENTPAPLEKVHMRRIILHSKVLTAIYKCKVMSFIGESWFLKQCYQRDWRFQLRLVPFTHWLLSRLFKWFNILHCRGKICKSFLWGINKLQVFHSSLLFKHDFPWYWFCTKSWQQFSSDITCLKRLYLNLITSSEMPVTSSCCLHRNKKKKSK